MQALLEPFLDAAVVLGALILFVRINGLRSFSKMSSFDFAATIATGSIVGAVILNDGTDFPVGIAAVAAILVVQGIVSRVRAASRAVESTLDNTPLLLMEGETILDANLARANMTKRDLIAKLREANVLDPAQVRAVVLETTGDVSVLHGDGDDPPLSDFVMEGVARGHGR